MLALSVRTGGLSSADCLTTTEHIDCPTTTHLIHQDPGTLIAGVFPILLDRRTQTTANVFQVCPAR